MLQRDVYALNSKLASHFRNKNPKATWYLFVQAHRDRLSLTAHTFTPVLGACQSLGYPMHGQLVHASMIKHGADTGTVSKTALINMYSKSGRMDDSVKVFDEVRVKDVVVWNALITSYLRNGRASDALGVFAAMRNYRVELSEFTLCSVSKVCASLKVLRQGKQVHGLVVVMGRDLVVLGTALIDFYSSVMLMSEAMKVYSTINCEVDDIMLNALLSGCVKNREYRDAFQIMSKIEPNVRAFTSVLTACSDSTDIWIGRQIHCAALRHCLNLDTQLSNVILDMYAKCGKILQARALFERIEYKDVVSWTSMIHAYGVYGYGTTAIELFKRWCETERTVVPNSVTFLVVLSACGHAGLVEEGRQCFHLMREKYDMRPEPEHYVCFMDILSKAGEIEEIWNLFDDMVGSGVERTNGVWAVLVKACSLHMDVQRGEFAARCLLELGPDEPTNYVLVSNFYAAIGKWDCVDRLRCLMKEKGLLKQSGSSWVSVAC